MPNSAPQGYNRRVAVDYRDVFYRTAPDIKTPARPVDAMVTPQTKNLAGVLSAVTSMQQSLGQYTQLKQLQNVEDEKKGAAMQARGEAKPDSGTALIRGYETLEGKARVAEYRLAYEDLLDEAKNDDPEAWQRKATQLRDSFINGMSDNHLRGFIPEAMQIEESAGSAYREHQQKVIKENTRTFNRQSLANNMEQVLRNSTSMPIQPSNMGKGPPQGKPSGPALRANYSGPYASLLESAAGRHVPGDAQFATLMNRMLKRESSGDANAVGPVTRYGTRARGLMQLMPGTAREMGVNDIFDPEQNIEGGVKYAALQYKKYKGDPVLTLVAYNWGPDNADKWAKTRDFSKLPDETQKYVMNILGKSSPEDYQGGALDAAPPKLKGPTVDMGRAIPAIHQIYKESREAGRAANLSNAEIQEDFVDTLTEMAITQRAPELFQAAYIPDESGISLIHSGVPGIEERIISGMKAAEAARDQYENRIERDLEKDRREAARMVSQEVMKVYTSGADSFTKGQQIQQIVRSNIDSMDPGHAKQFFDIGEAMAASTFGTVDDGATLQKIREAEARGLPPEQQLELVNQAVKAGQITENTYGQAMNRISQDFQQQRSAETTLVKQQQAEVWANTEAEIKAAYSTSTTDAGDNEVNISKLLNGGGSLLNPAALGKVSQASTLFWESILEYKKKTGEEPRGIELLNIRKSVLSNLNLPNAPQNKGSMDAGITAGGAPSVTQAGLIPSAQAAGTPQATMDQKLQEMGKERKAGGSFTTSSGDTKLSDEEFTKAFGGQTEQQGDIVGNIVRDLDWVTKPFRAILGIPSAAVQAPFKFAADNPEEWKQMPAWEKTVVSLKSSASAVGQLFSNVYEGDPLMKDVGGPEDVVRYYNDGKTLEESLPPGLQWAAPIGYVLVDVLMDPTLSAAAAHSIISSVGTRRLAQELAAAGKYSQVDFEASETIENIMKRLHEPLSDEEKRTFRWTLKNIYENAQKMKNGDLETRAEGASKLFNSTMAKPDAERTVSRQLPAPPGTGFTMKEGSTKALPPPSRQFVTVDPQMAEGILQMTRPMGQKALPPGTPREAPLALPAPGFVLMDKGLADTIVRMRKASQALPMREQLKQLPYSKLPETEVIQLPADQVMEDYAPALAKQAQGLKKALQMESKGDEKISVVVAKTDAKQLIAEAAQRAQQRKEAKLAEKSIEKSAPLPKELEGITPEQMAEMIAQKVNAQTPKPKSKLRKKKKD